MVEINVTKAMIENEEKRTKLQTRGAFLIYTTCNHHENMPMQYTEIFKVVKNENFG